MEEKQVAISVRGATEGRLQGVDLDLPLESLICFTGRNGSGSRNMAVDVLYAESRRRYMLALSPGEREGLGGMSKVEVESISGLPPAALFDGREKRFRGSVAAFLQVDGLLGQLLQRCGRVHCADCGGVCQGYTPEQAVARGLEMMAGERCLLLAPLVLEDESAGQGVLREVRQAGFLRVRLGTDIHRLDGEPLPSQLLRGARELEVIVDRLVPDPGNPVRLMEGVRNARAIARGRSLLEGVETGRRLLINQQLTCDTCGMRYENLTPDDFLGAGSADHPLLAQVTLEGRSLADIQALSIAEAARFTAGIEDSEGLAAAISRRLEEGNTVGIGHLPWGRSLTQVSTGESLCLLLANCLGNGLVGILYLFEGVSAALHAEDGACFVEGMRRLVELGNTVIALDHTSLLLEKADYIGDFADGEVQLSKASTGGTFREFGTEREPVPERGHLLIVGKGGPNLKPFELRLPLGQLTVVTGRSGAGKSVFLHRVVIPLVQGKGGKEWQAEYRGHRGLHRVVEVGVQGKKRDRTLLEELGLGEYISRIYAEAPAARRREYPAEWFRLDSPGGRCTGCEGRGILRFDMQFMEDIALVCPVCEGRRFRAEILDITWRGMNMGDVLNMEIARAVEYFAREQRLRARLEAAQRCGLDHLLLGDSVVGLERVEWLRLQLAGELVRAGERELIVLDMPAGGEHPLEVAPLVEALRALVGRGATVLAADNHPALTAAADFIVEAVVEDAGMRGEIRGYPTRGKPE